MTRWLKQIAALTALITIAACAETGDYRRIATTDVKGFGVAVEQSRADAGTYRAQGASKRDRARLDNAYFARNVIGIRNVAGCPLKPELIRHDGDGPYTVGKVVC
ncbi:hypothetical protein FIU94_04040 [Sulfitobacter sp. THAF37]|uniref:hypothetical protein n=1 Tax=Sulfitobacter sp. THAF37 TaxID=2587855 RepID=UPI0012695654|nr:hypothetical protein [Sulfitobacter sp. THAF37]QFT57986.1 hypothetical protein FIU94_04040 [Sulfitobacter sp. THAF37]